MKESRTVSDVTRELTQARRWFVNYHGSGMGTDGVPDFLTMTSSGQLAGIEAKRPGEKPTVNQFRQGLKIVLSGGLYFIAYPDFDISDLDAFDDSRDGRETRYFSGRELGDSEFDTCDAFQKDRSLVCVNMTLR